MDMPHLRLAPTPRDDDVAEQTIGVVLADEHALMRRTLRRLLDEETGVEVIAEASDLDSLVRHMDAHQPRVLVLDLAMPDGASSETIRELRERLPEMQIVIVTMEENPVFAQRALAAGAIGFVLKDRADEELPEAIHLAARGERYVSPRLAPPPDDLRRVLAEDGLTARETEVLRLITLGHTSVEIAQQLQLSPRTVETHRARIHRKLALATRAELVAYALGRGLLRA
jgi:two-component system, NarL family, response regulator NreC